MKAIRIHEFGPTEEVLQYEDVPVPEPKADELLVKVEAASLNRADLGLRSGNYRISRDALPIVPGREFAGTVEKIGAKITEFGVGQRVIAQPGLGAYAEYAVTLAAKTRPLPDGVDSVTAAAIPTVFLTAWFALLADGGLEAGELLLVQAGSSGVGNAAIQVGKHVGATVITTSGTDEKCRRLAGLGADHTVNYVREDFREAVMRLTQEKGVDVVLEMIGGDVYQKSLEVLGPGGRLVSIGGAVGPIPDKPPSLKGGRKASRFSVTNYLNAHPEGFQQVDRFLDLIRDGKFRVVIGKTFPLSETRAAQRYLEGREHFGKVVLTM